MAADEVRTQTLRRRRPAAKRQATIARVEAVLSAYGLADGVLVRQPSEGARPAAAAEHSERTRRPPRALCGCRRPPSRLHTSAVAGWAWSAVIMASSDANSAFRSQARHARDMTIRPSPGRGGGLGEDTSSPGMLANRIARGPWCRWRSDAWRSRWRAPRTTTLIASPGHGRPRAHSFAVSGVQAATRDRLHSPGVPSDTANRAGSGSR